MYLRLDAQREILAHGYSSFEVLLAFLTHQFSPEMRWPEGGKRYRQTQRGFLFLVANTQHLYWVNCPDWISNCENTWYLLSLLCSDVLFPRNCVWIRSCEGLPSHRLGTRKYQSVAYSQSHRYSLPLVDDLFLSYLKVLFTDAASFTQALHDGFIPQDVLLA